MPALVPIRFGSSPEGTPKRPLVAGTTAPAPPASCVNSGHAAAFLARTLGLNPTYTNAYTTFLNAMDADNLSCLFDYLRIYASQDSDTALLNLIQDRFNGTVFGSPTFTAGLGFTGVDASIVDYINSDFNPAIEAATSNFQQNDAHLSVWNLTNATSVYGPIGASDTVNDTQIFPKYIDNNAYFRVNVNGIGDPTSIGTPLGHFLANHHGVNNDCVHDGVNAGTYVDTSQAVVNLNFYDLAVNNNGVVLGSGNQIAAVSCGAALTPAQWLNFYTNLRTYMTAVGVP